MALGVWCFGISEFAAAGIVLAAFFYAVMLKVRPEYDKEGLFSIALACAVFMLIGASRLAVEEQRYKAQDFLDDGNVHEVVCEITGVEKENRMTARVLTADGRKTDARILLTYKGEEYGHAGDEDETYKKTVAKDTRSSLTDVIGSVIALNIRISKPDPERNPRCFDYREYLRSRGIGHVATCYSFDVVKENAGLISLVKRNLIKFREIFIAGIPGDKDSREKQLIRGVLFGDTGTMEEDMKEDFRRNGTAHILAVSGLHIGLLYAAMRSIKKQTGSKSVSFLMYVILLLYGTITLWTVSVTRAIFMVFILELGEKTDRRYDLLTSLGFVSMLVLLRNPYALFGASFIMSYLAVLSIGIILPALESKVSDKVPKGILTSLSVQAGLLPYTVYTFNMVPLSAVIVNIPVVLILSVLVTLSAVAIPVSLVGMVLPASGALQSFIMTISVLFARLMIYINSWFSDLDFLSPDVVSPPLFIVFLIYAVFFLMCSENFRIARMRKDREAKGLYEGVMLSVVMISLLVSFSPFDKADIVMVDVGQGDSVHFRFDGAEVMIDGGGQEEYNVGKKTLKPYLLKNGVRRIDLAYATHLHTDHYKGLTELKDEGMISKLLTKGKTGDVIKIEHGGLIPKLKTLFGQIPGAKALFGKNETDRIEIIYPDVQDPDTDDENKNSLIFKVYIKGRSVLITGDLGNEGEHALVEKYRGTDMLDSDILKVCHHGSSYSSSEEFIEAVSPDIAIIGVGKNNTYGHPAPEVIKRLKKHGISVFRTDLDGAIGIRIRGDQYSVDTVLKSRGS